MRKAIGIAVLTALILSFSGCASMENPHTTGSSSQDTVVSEARESTEPEESPSTSFSESKESSKPTTALARSKTKQTEISTPAEKEKTKIEQIPPAEESRSSQTEPPKTVQPKPIAPPTKPAEEPPKTEPPQESAPSVTDKPTAPAFNIQTWIDYAAEYATSESVGLNLSPDATACWDNPITAGPHSLYLERDIQSRLNRYARDKDITNVWIWAEKRSDGSYDLYIGYA